MKDKKEVSEGSHEQLIQSVIGRFSDTEKRINALLNFLYCIHTHQEVFSQILSKDEIEFVERTVENGGKGFLEALLREAHNINDAMTASRHVADMLNDAYTLKLAMTFLDVPEVRYELLRNGDLTPDEVRQLEIFLDQETEIIKDILIEAINKRLRTVMEDNDDQFS